MIRVTITKVLEPFWGTDEELADYNDSQLVALLWEDINQFLEGADWDIERVPAARRREEAGEP